MGKTKNSPNSSLAMRSLKRKVKSDTESEESSEEDIKTPAPNLGAKIKSEPQNSSEDSESDSDETEYKVVTRKYEEQNTNTDSSSSEEEVKTVPIRHKQQANKKDSSEEDSGNDRHQNLSQTNKYLLSESGNISKNKSVIKSNKIVNQRLEDSDDSSSSSSSGHETLRGAFLGQTKKLTKTKLAGSKLKKPVPVLSKAKDSSSKEDNQSKTESSIAYSSDRLQQISSPNETSKKKKKAKNLESISKPVLVNNVQTGTPTLDKKGKKKRKSNTSLSQSVETQEHIPTKDKEVERNDSSVRAEDNDDNVDSVVTPKSFSDSPKKIQIHQHLKFTPQKPFELLQETYPDLVKINIKDTVEISKNEEVFLLRIPKTIDPETLIDKEFDLEQISKVKIKKKKYEMEPTNKPPPAFLCVSSRNRIIQPKNTFYLKRYIKPNKIPDIELTEKKTVPLPSNLKARHPLFGSEYEDKILLSKDAEFRLQKAIEDCLKQDEKAQKKKKKKKSSVVNDDQSEVIFSLLSSHNAVPRETNNEEQYDSAFGSSESFTVSAKKKKNKTKKDNTYTELEPVLNNLKTEITYDDDDMKEMSVIPPLEDHVSKRKEKNNRRSSVFGDQTIFESTRIDIKSEIPDEEEAHETMSNNKQSIIEETLQRMKSELLTEYESEVDSTTRKKKKKKRKSQQNEKEEAERIDMEIFDNMKEEIMSDFGSSKSRKRTMSMLGDDNDVSEVVRKKSKKSKKHAELSEDSKLFDLDSELDSLVEKVRKDKKKRKSL